MLARSSSAAQRRVQLLHRGQPQRLRQRPACRPRRSAGRRPRRDARLSGRTRRLAPKVAGHPLGRRNAPPRRRSQPRVEDLHECQPVLGARALPACIRADKLAALARADDDDVRNDLSHNVRLQRLRPRRVAPRVRERRAREAPPRVSRRRRREQLQPSDEVAEAGRFDDAWRPNRARERARSVAQAGRERARARLASAASLRERGLGRQRRHRLQRARARHARLTHSTGSSVARVCARVCERNSRSVAGGTGIYASAAAADGKSGRRSVSMGRRPEKYQRNRNFF